MNVVEVSVGGDQICSHESLLMLLDDETFIDIDVSAPKRDSGSEIYRVTHRTYCFADFRT